MHDLHDLHRVYALHAVDDLHDLHGLLPDPARVKSGPPAMAASGDSR